MRSFSSHVLPFVCRTLLIAGLATTLAACSTTPDRYAFWRDNAPAAEATETKPNLADIPASPNVDQARRDMLDLQHQMTTERDAATQQAQADHAIATGQTTDHINNKTSLGSVGDTPKNNAKQSGNIVASPDMSTASMLNAPSAPTSEPVPQIADLPPPALAYPVYVPPSVQINPVGNPVVPNPPLRPYASLQPAPDYAYGRGNLPVRQSVTEASAIANSPGIGVPSLADNDNVSVDLSALGVAPASGYASARRYGGPPFGRTTNLAAAGINGVLSTVNNPAIYFKHGSTRLSAHDRDTLAALASTAITSQQPVRLVGHASSRTATKSRRAAKAVNLRISGVRATHVMDELKRKGVPAQQIETTAVGDRDAPKERSEATSRRVDLLIGQ